MPEQSKRRRSFPFQLTEKVKGSMAMKLLLSRWLARWTMRLPPSPSATHIPFQAIMDIAYRVGQTTPAALIDLIRLLGRKVQADRIAQVAMQFEKTTLLDFHTVLFGQNIPITADGQCLYDLLEERAQVKILSLAHDIVLALAVEQGQDGTKPRADGDGKASRPLETRFESLCRMVRTNSNWVGRKWEPFASRRNRSGRGFAPG